MLQRTTYGELIATTPETKSIISGAMQMAAKASAKGKIPQAFDAMAWGKSGKERGHRIGDAVHHEIYDVSADGRKALVCVRAAEGTKYGVSTKSKEYFLISRHGSGLRVTEANKAVAAKAAKSCGEMLGGAIAVCEGKAKLVVKGSMAEKRTGYKLVALDENGETVSAWDGSPWPLGKCRTEKATPDHEGGYYYYRDLTECLEAASKNETFGSYRAHKKLLVVSVEASGTEYKIGQGKLCATRLKPLEIICSTL